MSFEGIMTLELICVLHVSSSSYACIMTLQLIYSFIGVFRRHLGPGARPDRDANQQNFQGSRGHQHGNQRRGV
jgi:hypothetical protein